jgi:hypothetical protein
MEKPRVSPAAPGGLEQWLLYIADRVVSTESYQAKQNGAIHGLDESVKGLAGKVAELPCSVHSEKLSGLEQFKRDCSERQYQETRDSKQRLTSFLIQLFTVLAGFGLGLLVTRF